MIYIVQTKAQPGSFGDDRWAYDSQWSTLALATERLTKLAMIGVASARWVVSK